MVLPWPTTSAIVDLGVTLLTNVPCLDGACARSRRLTMHTQSTARELRSTTDAYNPRETYA
jgi:hypothetical protein